MRWCKYWRVDGVEYAVLNVEVFLPGKPKRKPERMQMGETIVVGIVVLIANTTRVIACMAPNRILIVLFLQLYLAV